MTIGLDSFFLYAIFLETERERFFFLIGGGFILNVRGVQDATLGVEFF